jgi:predicted MFS family arabinose efflux permease
VFGAPGLWPVYIASVVGRLPQGAVGLVLLLRTKEMAGSYAAGGAVAAAYGIAYAIGSPILGRVIDRRGQSAVLVPGALVASAALAGFAALPDSAPLVAGLALAVVSGVSTPPVNSCLRALLQEVVAPELRHRAFAIDSTMFELVYIAGPTLLVGVVGAWSMRGAALACAVLGLAGTVAFAATRLSREARGAETISDRLAGPLRTPAVRTLLAATGLFGLCIACLEVGLAAFAAGEGHRTAVGFLLACSGVGSMLGGLIASSTRPPTDAARRLALLLAATAVLSIPAGLVHSLPAMAVAIGVSGLGISPSLALIFGLTADYAPDGTTTEALTWLSSFMNLGVAFGSALAGALVDAAGTTVVLLGIAAYCAAAAATVGWRLVLAAT